MDIKECMSRGNSDGGDIIMRKTILLEMIMMITIIVVMINTM